MIRVNQYRPNLRKNTYGKVKTSQFSKKVTDAGIFNALDTIAYRGRFALGEEITELTILTDEGKITSIWVECSNPKYKYVEGFNSFMVYYRPRKITTDFILSREEEIHKNCRKIF